MHDDRGDAVNVHIGWHILDDRAAAPSHGHLTFHVPRPGQVFPA